MNKKTAMTACVAALALALASQAFAAGPGARDRVIEEVAGSASTSLSLLSEDETQRLDAITSGAAARAVLALRCEGARFELTSRQIQAAMVSLVDQVSPHSAAARAYARDWAGMKYKAMALANTGAPCDSLSRLRQIAAQHGFGD